MLKENWVPGNIAWVHIYIRNEPVGSHFLVRTKPKREPILLIITAYAIPETTIHQVENDRPSQEITNIFQEKRSEKGSSTTTNSLFRS